MKLKLLWFGLVTCLSVYGQKPASIIFDTDIAPDYDDVGAMALLHAFADRGEAKILATISSNAFETTAPTLSVLNTYFRRPETPVGITRNALPNKDCRQEWAQYLLQHYPHAIRTNSEAREAVGLYREILSKQPDQTVTIVTVGFFTNLANLLDSRPDQYSGLTGMDLVRKKVKKLVSMAARLNMGDSSGYEFNVMVDPAASKKVFDSWPTPMILSGFEIGEKILTGIRLIHTESIQNSPVKDAFRIALTRDSNVLGRNSWDETAVWVAVRGIEPMFSSRKLNLTVRPDGRNVLVPGSKMDWLIFRQKPEEIGPLIEDLMMHQPEK